MPVYYKEFYEIGIQNITDLFEEKGGIIPFKKWVEKGLSGCSWLKWYGIVQSAKQFSKAAGKLNVGSAVTFVIGSKDIFQSTTKDICMCINEKNGRNTVTIPRIGNYISAHEETDWETIYTYPFKYLIDTKSKDFQYKFLHDVIVNMYWLEKWKISDTNLCRLCHKEVEKVDHMFWTCELVMPFWDHFNDYMEPKVNLRVDMDKVFFGMADIIANTIIINAKRYIYKAFLQEKEPTLNIFLHVLTNVIRIEQSICKRNSTLSEWEHKWQAFIANDKVVMT